MSFAGFDGQKCPSYGLSNDRTHAHSLTINLKEVCHVVFARMDEAISATTATQAESTSRSSSQTVSG